MVEHTVIAPASQEFIGMTLMCLLALHACFPPELTACTWLIKLRGGGVLATSQTTTATVNLIA